MFLRFSSFLKRQSRAVEMTKTLLQGRKADATNRSVGFSDSLNGIENYGIIFKYDSDVLKLRELKIATASQIVVEIKKSN